MFTTISKAIVGLVMALLFIVKDQFGIDLGIDEGTVSTGINLVIGLLGTFGIWKVSNET